MKCRLFTTLLIKQNKTFNSIGLTYIKTFLSSLLRGFYAKSKIFFPFFISRGRGSTTLLGLRTILYKAVIPDKRTKYLVEKRVLRHLVRRRLPVVFHF